MAAFERVTVALARAEGDAGLLEYARQLAALAPGALFQFVHVLEPPARGRDPAAVISHGEARAAIAAAAGRFFPDAAAHCRVLNGTRLDRLLECTVEERSDLLLVGHRRRRSGRRSLARRLAMQAPCSLLMVPEGAPPAIRGVLCAVDYSDHSALALSTAACIARQAALAECVALHVFFSVLDADPRPEAAFQRFAAPLDLHGVRVRPVFEQGPTVADCVTRLARSERADLIVVGTRGRNRSASILLGSESEQVLLETPVPVLIVKQRGERLSLLEALFDRGLSGRSATRFG